MGYKRVSMCIHISVAYNLTELIYMKMFRIRYKIFIIFSTIPQRNVRISEAIAPLALCHDGILKSARLL